ncbi:MAG TPA: hypothetical protein VLK33_06025 [Terriglobales bacterium]|nr:hypothetical protein [Terriglobales bacterium]
MPTLEQLGVVTSRSGVLIFIDTGYLKLWSHHQTPQIPDGVLPDEESTTMANSFVDLRLVGNDAERAGHLLETSWHPLYLYDQPPVNVELEKKLDAIILENHLDAHFEVTNPRIPHRKRVDLALEYGRGAGEIQFHGIWAVAVSGIPTDQPLRVMGERCEEPNVDRWRRVIVQCRSNQNICKSFEVGLIGVDHARILIADVDALSNWKHEEPLDGQADYVFWGRDADLIADALKVPKIGNQEFGWLNISIDSAQENGITVQDYRDKHSLKIALDYRPHSHHWQAMKAVREGSPTESSTTDLDGLKICNFMTTWGDGLFSVHRDLGDNDELIQIRIEMETKPS